MSCEVKPFGSIPELSEVQKLLGFSHVDSWLGSVYYSISPTGDVVAFGHGPKLVILNTNWIESKEISAYTITWKGELKNPNDIITAIICLPLYGDGINSVSGQQWTCVAVGVASGSVIFYSDSGLEVFSQKWHEEPVQSLKAHCTNEELFVNYISCICILKGNQIFPILSGLKHSLSKTIGSTAVANVSKFPDNIVCRKWEYRVKCGTVNDSVIVGQPNLCSFDHLLDQSLDRGFYAKPRSTPVQQSLVLGVGVKPFVGFYFAKEGYIPADLSFVAKAVANKVISSLPNWLYKTSSPSPQDVQQVPSGEPMPCRFGICDIQRKGFNVWLAPGNNLAAVVDNLSRVVLIDCNRGVALRVWKGYRDAQCAFVKAKEKKLKANKSEKKNALFLVIYAPRRAVLEIWALQNGPKIAAFNVSKNGQLIYNTHGLFGITSNAKIRYSAKRCVFMDPSDQLLKEIVVPFHCALSNEDSKTSKDVHLLRRIKLLLRNLNMPDQEIVSSCYELQTNEIRLQLVQFLVTNRKVKPVLLKSAMLSIMQSIQKDNTIESTYDLKTLLLLLESYIKLIDFYLCMNECSDEDPGKEEKLSLTELDIELIQKLLDLTKSSNESLSSKVTFENNLNESDFIDYLNIFLFEGARIKLNKKKSDFFGYVGHILFQRFFEKGYSLNSFSSFATESGIRTEDLMSLVLYYFLEKPFCYKRSEDVVKDMTRLTLIIQKICNLDDDKTKHEYSEVCPWWQSVREMILETPCALRGLLAAIACRNASQHMQKRDSSDENSEDENWEKVSQEAAQWSLLIGKLDDISVLGAILSNPLSSENLKLPKIPYEKPDCSLKSIVLGGQGIVVEYVAKWLASSGINPITIVEQIIEETTVMTSEEADHASTDIVLNHLKLLREHFPFSLESGVVLCQLTWEFMCYWSKNLSFLEYLKAGIICLAAFRPEDFVFKHGLCCMIWNAHLKIPLEAAKKLIHKAGRLPKEKLCQQDIGLSISAVPEFLENCLEFFKQFSSSLHYENKELRFEEILVEGQVPLVHLTIQQSKAIKEILELHIELCKVLHLIAFFSLKISKPMTLLFDALSNQTFFMEINRELPYSLPPPDLILRKQRQDFLCKAVSASIDLIREDLERLYILEHTTYMTQIEELADLWKLDKEVIKKHQVVEMYAHGWDAYAEELMEDIIDSDDMGRLLLEIAGRRLHLYTSKSKNAFMQVASIGPLVLNYLDNLNAKSNGIQITGEADDVELERLCILAAKAFACLAEKGQETRQLRIAGQLYDACCMLKAKVQLGDTLD